MPPAQPTVQTLAVWPTVQWAVWQVDRDQLCCRFWCRFWCWASPSIKWKQYPLRHKLQNLLFMRVDVSKKKTRRMRLASVAATAAAAGGPCLPLFKSQTIRGHMSKTWGKGSSILTICCRNSIKPPFGCGQHQQEQQTKTTRRRRHVSF